MLVNLPEKFDKMKVADGIYGTGLNLTLQYDPEVQAAGIRKLPDFELIVDTADRYIGCYGVCDSYEQILTYIPEIEESEQKFIISLTPIYKATQPEIGGWRWHKWGEYIGTQNPRREYIYDEPNIKVVYVYHIYRIEVIGQ